MDQLVSTFQTLGRQRLVALGGAGAAVFLLVIASAFMLGREEMVRLYTGLDPEMSGKLVAALEEQGAQIRVSDDGSILAPAADAPRLRMAMAAQGLPQRNGLGYELFDDRRSVGLTSFMQRINRTRALEGELSRSILTLEGVDAARVHLVLPERDAFSREPAQPSASVVVRTNTAGTLSANQAAAIRHLVAAAAPRLTTDNVTVLDAQHGMIAGPAGETGPAAAAGDARRQVEADLRAAVERMLNPVLGAGSLRVEVAAELVTAREVIREETFDPRSSALRSEQTVEELDDTAEAGETGAVSIEQNLPEGEIDETTGASARSSSERLEQTRNFELSSVVRERVLEPGDVARLAVAVIVDEAALTMTTTGDAAPQPDAEQLARIEALVRAAVGYSPSRGDVIEVAYMPFAEPLLPAAPPAPNVALIAAERADDVAKWLVFGVLGLVVVIVVLRPIARTFAAERADARSDAGAAPAIAAPNTEAAASADGDAPSEGAPANGLEAPAEGELKALPRPSISDALDQMMDLRDIEGQVRASSLQKLGRIVEEHPDEAVAIIRSWIYEEAA